MNRNIVALVVGICAVSAGAGRAVAQEVEAVEGVGYPLGEGTVIHPIAGAEVGFTDNVFYEDQQQNPSGLLRLLLEAAIASKEIEAEPLDPLLIEGDEPPAAPAQQKLQFRAGGRLAFNEYLSTNEVSRSQRNLAADLNGHLTVNPQGAVAFTADERFIRDTRPTNFESFSDTNRIANRLMLGLKWQPGGRTLNAGVRWENLIDFFEDSDQRFANRMINTIHARSEWEFFPYSKVFADVSYGFISGLGSNDLGGMAYKRSANPIRGGIGIATAITQIFTVKAHVGWAYASYAGGATYNRPIFGTELGWRYSPLGRLVVEYEWDHRDSVNADYYRDHKFGAHADHQFGKIVMSVRGDMRLRAYRGIHPSIGPSDRDDLLFAVGARGQYVFKDWMAFVADYKTEVDQTEYRTMFGGEVDDPSYVRTEVTGGVRIAF